MAVGANSYGSAAGVAAEVPRLAGSGEAFTSTTRPTLAQVETFIDEVSAMLNMKLAQEGFAIPLTQADAVLAMQRFVNEEVASLVERINGGGRFREITGTVSALMSKDVQEFIEGQSEGLERLGATRTYGKLSGLGYRSTDEQGNEVIPLFQREAFGFEPIDWDDDGQS